MTHFSMLQNKCFQIDQYSAGLGDVLIKKLCEEGKSSHFQINSIITVNN